MLSGLSHHSNPRSTLDYVDEDHGPVNNHTNNNSTRTSRPISPIYLPSVVKPRNSLNNNLTESSLKMVELAKDRKIKPRDQVTLERAASALGKAFHYLYNFVSVFKFWIIR